MGLARTVVDMIYAPGRFCFIHIPRCAGMAITEALARGSFGEFDVIAVTTPLINGLSRHATAVDTAHLIPDWDDIYRFAIWRPLTHIVGSERRLIRRDFNDGIHRNPATAAGYRSLLESRETVNQSLERWKRDVGDPWTSWTTDEGRSLGVDKVPMSELADRWPEICDRCQISQTSLRRLNS